LSASTKANAADALIAISAGALAGGLTILSAYTSPLVALIFLVALGIAVLALLRPIWAICLAVALIPLETVSASFQSFALSPAEFVATVTAVVWLMRRAAAGGPTLRSPLTLPLLGVLAIHIPGLLLATDQFAVVKELVVWSALFVLFLAVVADEAEKTPMLLAGAIATAGGVVALIAVLKTAGSNQVAVQFGGNVSDRATGSFSAPGLLGPFVAMTLPLQLLLMLKARSGLVRLGGLLATLLTLAALALALTRSAFVAVAIAGVWLLVTWKPARRLALVLILLCTLLLVSGFNPADRILNSHVLVDRIASISSPESHTAHLRFQVWSKTPRMIEDYPLFGVGADNYVKHAADYGLTSPGVPSHAHNIPLTVAAEFGVIGLLVLLWVALALLGALSRAMKTDKEPDHSIAVAVAAAFLAVAVDGIFDYAFSANAFFLIVMMLAAITARLARTAPAAQPVPRPAVPARAREPVPA
jgi:O-antigen ligase